MCPQEWKTFKVQGRSALRGLQDKAGARVTGVERPTAKKKKKKRKKGFLCFLSSGAGWKGHTQDARPEKMTFLPFPAALPCRLGSLYQKEG